MKIKCIAIDDEPMALDKMKNYIERIPYLELAGLCEGTHEAMKVLLSEKVDAIFIDINMPDMNGLEFIKTLADPPLVIFTTAYAEYAVEGYKVRAVDYLLKPFGFAEFQKASENLRKQFMLVSSRHSVPSPAASNNPEFLYMKVDYRYVRVVLKDIIYIEGMNEYLKIHLVSGDPFLTHTTFRQIKEKLPEDFIHLHRSFIVNMSHVKEVERSMVLMSDGARIPVSESNMDEVTPSPETYTLKK